tara:strand:+ start:130 stop:354 length:225 start_codon:yes stop_codon:yes gene_type:complete
MDVVLACILKAAKKIKTRNSQKKVKFLFSTKANFKFDNTNSTNSSVHMNKLAFSVVDHSGEDSGYEARELNSHS